MRTINLTVLTANVLVINTMLCFARYEARISMPGAIGHVKRSKMFSEYTDSKKEAQVLDWDEYSAPEQEYQINGHERNILQVDKADETSLHVEPMPPLGNYLTRVPIVCKQDYEIHTPQDLSFLQECTIVTGNIRVIEYKEPILTISNLEILSGSLTVIKSPWIVRIEAPNLVRITDTFSLADLTSLSLILFPKLNSVKVLEWKVLPILSSVEFHNEIRDLESITVSDTSLAGFSRFVAETLSTLDISNNRFLDTIVSNVIHITERLHISANSAEVVVDFPRLKTATNVSIHEVSEIHLDLLEEIGNSASLANNYFKTLKLPNLMTVGGTLSLLKNQQVSEVDFPSLTEIGGGLMLVNNSMIERINFFPNLTIIGGAIEMIGNIEETKFKLLKLVKGSARIKSLSSKFDCSRWTRSEIARVIRGGKIVCVNSENKSLISSSSPTGIEISNSRPATSSDEYSAELHMGKEHKEKSAALGGYMAISVLLFSIGLWFVAL